MSEIGLSEIDIDQISSKVSDIKKEIIEIEGILKGAGSANKDREGYRKQVFQSIFQRGTVNRDELYKILKKNDFDPQFIGIHVKNGYLNKSTTTKGDIYSVTEKAVDRYDLK